MGAHHQPPKMFQCLKLKMENVIVIGPYFLPQIRKEAVSLAQDHQGLSGLKWATCRGFLCAAPPPSPSLQAPEIKGKNMFRAE